MKSIIQFSRVMLLLLSFGFIMQGCKSDEDEILWGDLGDNLTITYGQPYQLLENQNYDDGILVVPAAMANLGVTVEQGKILEYEKGMIRGLGIGTTTVSIWQHHHNNVLKTITVTVVPTEEIEIQSGHTYSLQDLVKTNLSGLTPVSSDDKRVVQYDEGKVSALLPGEALLTNENVAIKVTVAKYPGAPLFEIPNISSYAEKDAVLKAMSQFTLVEESKEKVDGLPYITMKFAPYYNSKSITFYLIDSNWSYAEFAIVDTGVTNEDALGCYFTNFEATWNYWVVDYFTDPEAPNSQGYYRMRILPTNNDWAKPKLTFRLH